MEKLHRKFASATSHYQRQRHIINTTLPRLLQTNDHKRMRFLQKPTIPTKPSSLFPLVISLVLLSSSICILYLFFPLSVCPSPHRVHGFQHEAASDHPLTLDGIVFGIASDQKTWVTRKHYTRQWWRPLEMRGCVFLDKAEEDPDTLLPPTCQSGDTSRFHYMNRWGHRSMIRLARVVVEMVNSNYTNVRWFMFGDDDTVFFPENVVKVLSKYDDRLWYYVGSTSEVYEQNRALGFGMGFGGAGFGISYALAKVLAQGFDECIRRYSHLYGSDSRVYACLTELGVELTREPGFHQLDIRGDPFGILAAHPLAPLASLHHIDFLNPIFPNMTRAGALQHLFEAANIDSQRLLQQTVCYAHSFPWTISVSWGYAVQIFPEYMPLPELLHVQQTFRQWKRGDVLATTYMFKTTKRHPDPCRRATVFFMKSTTTHEDRIKSTYAKAHDGCSNVMATPRRLNEVKVLSHKLDLDIEQLKAPRRHCCDVLDSSVVGDIMEIGLRGCGDIESVFFRQV